MEPTSESAPDGEAVRQLLSSKADVGRVSGRHPVRDLLHWISRGRLGRHSGWPEIPRLPTPWQDTITVRTGWRQRAANLADPATREGEFVFAVDYRVCGRCGLGWVEEPYTIPRYQRMGIASAGLSALRDERPGLAWHTLGGHLGEARLFWSAAGRGVPGGYSQRELCKHARPKG
ncbi:hypothetical protein [Kribbella italica]|uniref:Uncharacterized protein n=1 Tax=Kribbella italica TaxID=1540520 RepID=A0A7W9JEU5_9ACTN|nr:hypothetical protein [Kribbella italica]MBB5840178.1 hypothetical protein [Kribbella italica]